MKKFLSLVLLSLTCLVSSCSSSNINSSQYIEKDEKVSFSYSKEGVDSFYSQLETREDEHIGLLNKDSCYNITTDNLKSLDVNIFKFEDECDTYMLYKDDIYYMGASFGGYGFINAVTCDFDNNGVADILFTHSFGSGIHRSVVSLFNMTTLKVTNLFSSIEQDASNDEYMADLVLEKTIEDEKPIYNAYVSTIYFESGFIASSCKKTKIYKTINLSDYSNNQYYDVKVDKGQN